MYVDLRDGRVFAVYKDDSPEIPKQAVRVVDSEIDFNRRYKIVDDRLVPIDIPNTVQPCPCPDPSDPRYKIVDGSWFWEPKMRHCVSSNGEYLGMLDVVDNPDAIVVPTAPNNQEYEVWNGEQWVVDINKFKVYKKLEIEAAFNLSLSGSMFSNSLQKEVNIGEKHLRNVEKLISYMQANNITETQFRVYDNSFITVTLTQLQNLRLEMIQYGLDMYQKKWQLEQQIDAATNEEELAAIVW